jgi:hypothetical protein
VPGWSAATGAAEPEPLTVLLSGLVIAHVYVGAYAADRERDRTAEAGWIGIDGNRPAGQRAVVLASLARLGAAFAVRAAQLRIATGGSTAALQTAAQQTSTQDSWAC